MKTQGEILSTYAIPALCSSDLATTSAAAPAANGGDKADAKRKAWGKKKKIKPPIS